MVPGMVPAARPGGQADLSTTSSLAGITTHDPVRRWGVWIPDLYPIRAPARAVGPIPALRDDAFGTQRAGMSKNRLAVAIEVLGKADA